MSRTAAETLIGKQLAVGYRLTRPRRFWAKVRKTEGCWEWTGWVGTYGYGILASGPEGRQVEEKAHRVSWELHNGSIPVGLSVLHRCDNRRCVRPDHLFLGTQADNMHDMAAKGRGTGRLTPEQVVAIRERAASGQLHSVLAEAFGVSDVTIGNVVRGRVYAWVSVT